MHGPRTSGAARRERRKTVTFHERCDVLEYDRESESEEEDTFRSCDEQEPKDLDDDEYELALANDTDPFLNQDPSHQQDDSMEQERSYESTDLSAAGLNPAVPSLFSDPDSSITGIVDEMFANVRPSTLSDDTSNPSTPPRLHDLPTDLETEDGVPFGRSHHVERFLKHHRQPAPPQFSPHASPRHSPSSYPHNLGLPTHASPNGPPATPPRRSPFLHSTPPLGHSAHQEQQQERDEEEALGRDVDNLPASPSPMKHVPPSSASRQEGLIASFNLKPSEQPSFESDLLRFPLTS
jgi:hypothetical protein